MYCGQIMVVTVHVPSDHGRTVHRLPVMAVTGHVLSAMGVTVHVLSDHGMDISCTVRSWDGQFMYCQIMVWTFHVLSDHGMDSSCNVRPLE